MQEIPIPMCSELKLKREIQETDTFRLYEIKTLPEKARAESFIQSGAG